MLQVVLNNPKNIFNPSFLCKAIQLYRRSTGNVHFLCNKRLVLHNIDFKNKFCLQLVRCFFVKGHKGIKHQAKTGSDIQSNSTNPIEKLKQSQETKIINLSEIKYASSFAKNEPDAHFLLSLCKKIIYDANRNELVMTANQIFKVCGAKSISLLNLYVNLLIDCRTTFDPALISDKIKHFDLIPNQETNLNILASFCLNGDVNKAIEFTKNSISAEPPNKVFGYFSYGLCKANKPEEAIKLFVKNCYDPFCWESFIWLLSGLANSNPSNFNLAIEICGKNLKSGISITHALEVFYKLSKQDYFKDIKQLLTYLTVTEDDIDLASRFMLKNKFDLESSAYFLECLYDQLNCPLKENMIELHPLNTIFMYTIQQVDSVEQSWKKMTKLKKCFPSGQWLEMFILSVLMEHQPWNVKGFLLKMNKKPSNYVMYTDFKIIESLPSQLKISLLRINSYYNNVSTYEKTFPKLKIALSQDNSILLSTIADIFYTDVRTNSIDSSLVINSIIYFLRQAALGKWSFKQFQVFCAELHKQGFQIVNDDLFYIHLMLDEKFSFVIDEILFHQKSNLPTFPVRIFSCEGISAKKSLFLQMPHSCNPVHGQYDAVIDGIKNDLNNQSGRSKKDLINLYHSLCASCQEKIDVKKNSSAFNAHEIKILPASVIKSKNNYINHIIKEYLSDKYGTSTAFLIYLFSFLKENMLNHALKFVKLNQNFIPNFPQFFPSNLKLGKDLFNVNTEIVELANKCETYGMQQIVYYTVEHLLLKGSFEEANKFLLNVKSTQSFYKLAKIYLYFDKQPPPEILPNKLKPLPLLLADNNTSVQKLCDQIQVAVKGSPNPWYDYIFCLLSNFYLRVSVDKFNFVTKQVQEVLPIFNPLLQSQIFLDQLEKHSKISSFRKTFDFASKNLKECNKETLNTWKSAIHLLGNFALDSNDFEALQKLEEFCLKNSFPEIYSIALSYKFYFQLQQKNVSCLDFLNDDKFKVCLPDLVRLISNFNDKNSLEKLCSIVTSSAAQDKESFYRFMSFCVLNNCNFRFIQTIFTEQNVSIFEFSKIASILYSAVNNLEDLCKIDKFYRKLTSKCIRKDRMQESMQGLLNHYLFCSFTTLCKNSEFNGDIINYLIKMFDSVPSRKNTLFARTVYIDLQTCKVFGKKQNRTRCIYC